MKVIHEIQSPQLKAGQHIALVSEETGKHEMSPWGVSIDPAPGCGVVLICKGVSDAMALFQTFENGLRSGKITGIQEG